jgi:iron complex transport system substrate-binding protein
VSPLLATTFLAAALAATSGPAQGGGAGPAPRRVVSMNLCADELVLRLADRAQIAAVTWLARDPRGSTVAGEAAGVGVNRGLPEEVVALRTDLVVAGAFTTRTTVGLLRRLDLDPLELGVPTTFDEVRAQVRLVATALDHPERGEAMIAMIDAALAASAPSGENGARPRALVLRPNGFTVGPGTLGDAILVAAGLTNLSAALGHDRGGSVPLEVVANARPDLLIVDDAREGPPSLADELLHHPILRALPSMLVVAMPTRLWTCPGPQLAEAVARLSAARRAFLAGGRP